MIRSATEHKFSICPLLCHLWLNGVTTGANHIYAHTRKRNNGSFSQTELVYNKYNVHKSTSFEALTARNKRLRNTWEDNLQFNSVVRFTVLYYCYIISNAAHKINMDIIRYVIKFRAGICICIKFTQRPLTTAGTMKESGKYVMFHYSTHFCSCLCNFSISAVLPYTSFSVNYTNISVLYSEVQQFI